MRYRLLLSFLLTVLSTITMAQTASNNFEFENIKYEITSESTAKVVRVITRLPDKPLPISYYYPEYVIPTFALDRNGKKYKVTCIGEGAFHVDQALDEYKVVVPASVSRIEKEAFYQTPLAEIILSDGLEYIGEEAFAGTSLRSLTIPGTVKELGKGICSRCRQLQRLTVAEGVSGLPEDMCEYVSTLKDVNLAGSIRVIGKSAFRKCDSVNVIQWPSQLQVIHDYAFVESGVTNGSFPVKLQEIGDFAFFSAKIKKVVLPASFIKIGDAAFHSINLECFEVNNANPEYASFEGLLMNKDKTEILVVPLGKKGHQHLPSTLREVGKFAFLGSSVEEVTLPPTLKIIRKGGFEDCGQLRAVHFSEGLDSIGEDAFRRCSQLSDISLPASLKSVSGNAFYLCSALNDIDLSPANKYLVKDDGDIYDAKRSTLVVVAPGKSGSYTVRDGVTRIGSHAFSLTDKLAEVNMPGSVRYIDEGAFAGCTLLQRLSLSPALEEIGDWAFYDCGELMLPPLPASLKKLGRYAFDKNYSLESIVIPDGVRLLPEGLFRECKNLTSVQLPEGLTTVDPMAFQDCESLTGITLPSSVTSLGYSVFTGCKSLGQVTLPKRLRTLPEHFFAKCQSLQHVTLPESIDSIMNSAFIESGITTVTLPKGLKYLGKSAFYKCEQLQEMIIPEGIDTLNSSIFYGCKALRQVQMPVSLRHIDDYAFSNCESLKEVVIPEGVERLGVRSFEFCLSLETIDMPSTLKEVGREAFVRVDHPQTIIIRATTPPKGRLALRYLKNTAIYLPAGTIKAYASGLLRDCYRLESIAQEIK